MRLDNPLTAIEWLDLAIIAWQRAATSGITAASTPPDLSITITKIYGRRLLAELEDITDLTVESKD